jgi:predicted RNase H-like HicB family nuclease
MQLTCLVKKEGRNWSSICIELDVASCGNTRQEAIDGLQRVIESYVEYMTEEGRTAEIIRPVPISALREFLIEEEREEKTRRFNAFPLEVACA